MGRTVVHLYPLWHGSQRAHLGRKCIEAGARHCVLVLTTAGTLGAGEHKSARNVRPAAAASGVEVVICQDNFVTPGRAAGALCGSPSFLRLAVA